MSSDFTRILPIEITVRASQPELLTGLDVWLRLGLISESQVRKLSQKYLTCPLPQPIVVKPSSRITESDISQKITKKVQIPVQEKRSLLSQAWQAFKDELSVRWLLFLGVFLVVVSSGVLAATQWERFPAAGQYGVLWTYTLIFWGVGFWAGKQDKLQLTAQTLQTITLLLIPVNFWAIDTFGLWENPWEWITVAIASVTLTGITSILSQHKSILFFNFLGLTYLHWGWKILGFSLIAVYIAMIGTSIILRFIIPRQKQKAEESNKLTSIGIGFVVYALSVLLVRAIFVVHLPIQQLGLAIGICGWLLPVTSYQLPVSKQQSPIHKTLEVIGATLLFLGWLVSVEDFPWQAIAVSGLALHFCFQRLRRYWLRRDLLGIFIIGLQSLILIRELIPIQFRSDVINLSIEIAQSQTNPYTVYSITLFPYVIFVVWLTGWIYRQEKAKLASFGEWLTLGLGIILTLIGLANPTWRSLNLLLSTATLAYVTYRSIPIRVWLVYFTNFVGLLSISSTIDWWFPNLIQPIWATILLVLMVAEWSISILPFSTSNTLDKNISRSCWHIGIALSGISYMLLLNEVSLDNIYFVTSNKWVLLWLLTPLTLTAVASLKVEKRRIQAAFFSCGALILAQSLTLWQPEVRLISLGVATGLMLLNTRYLRHLLPAVIHLGFVISFIAALLWNHISISEWFLSSAIAIIFLWLLQSWLRKYTGTLAALYAQAADRWAITICSIELGLLTRYTVTSYQGLISTHWQYLATSILIGSAIIYRYWQQPHNLTIFGISWAVELALAEVILLASGSTLELATANISLGLLTLGFTYWLRKKQSRLSRITSLEILPLIYAVIGICLRFGYFTAYTGFLTLGAGLIGIGVGCRRRDWKPINYLSFVAISFACYELVIYQMLNSPAGSPADGFTLLAIVAAAIALIYRIFAWVWHLRGNNTFLNLSLGEFKIIAHIHWAIGSIFKLLAAGIAIESNPRLTPISIAVSLILAAYALIQGRDTDNQKSNDWWVYIGLVEIAATTVYARLIWTQLSILDPWRAILACIVALAIYQIPWSNWGWQPTPWHRTALVIPALMVLVTAENISYPSLLVVAAFYARIAIKQRNIRWSYVSLGFIDWTIARFLSEQNLTYILWYASIIGLSILYIAQFDPELIKPQKRQNRHHLRIFGSGIICLVALLYHQDTGLIPAIISLGFVFAGIGLQIRAFLFVGTTNFLLTAFYQLVVLILDYPFTKWVIGLMAGIILISIAANFEKRREQIITMLQNWFYQLSRWQ
ncbi:MAG: hypothetical protein F6K10_14110 [Moorea sp. SIO2B7]|nr:hypothetical protein [Moorena sp. SIO2B7]